MLDVFGSVQGIVFWALTLGALGVKGYALFDAFRVKQEAYSLAGKLTKNIWLLILGVALAVNIVVLNPLNFLNLIGVVAAAVYLVDVRPAVKQVGGGGSRGTHMGPYGDTTITAEPAGSSSTTRRCVSGTAPSSKATQRTGSSSTGRPSIPAAADSHPTTACCCGTGCGRG